MGERISGANDDLPSAVFLFASGEFGTQVFVVFVSGVHKLGLLMTRTGWAARGETAPPSGVEGRLSLLQGKRHEARLIAGLNLHQDLDGVLVLVGLGTIHRLLDASSDI